MPDANLFDFGGKDDWIAPPPLGEFWALVSELAVVGEDTARRALALDTAGYIRERFPSPTLVALVLDSELSVDKQTAEIGKLIVQTARIECLLGWIHHGGVNRKTKRFWEHEAPNRGAFPSYYQNVVLTHGRKNGSRWCTSFVGALVTQLGFRFNPNIAVVEASSIFWSGFRFNRWHQTGKTILGGRAAAYPVTAEEDPGSQRLGPRSFRQLAIELGPVESKKSRLDVLNGFLAARFRPQPGDVLLFPHHTMLVEDFSFDGILRTIEGNTGHAVRSRTIDLTDPSAVRGPGSHVLGQLLRIGAAFFRDPALESFLPSVSSTTGREAADTLTDTGRLIINALCKAAATQGWVMNDDPDAWVHDWIGGSTTGSVT